jgi:hypothetical protein
MVLFQIVVAFLFFLPFYFVPVFLTWMILKALGVSPRWRMFFSISIFGIFLGLLCSLSLNNKEAWFTFNMPGMYVGEQVYICAIQNFGDSHSAFAHFTIPWILRIPQGYFLPTAVIWSFLGAIAQFIYNLFKKPVAAKSQTILIAGLSTLALFCLSFGMIYGLQSSTDKYGPTEPSAVPMMELIIPSFGPGGTPIPQPPHVTYADSTSFRFDNLTLSNQIVERGRPLLVSALITNTGPTEGMATVEIKINGITLNNQKVALSLGESKTVKFMVDVPQPGTYTLSIGDQTEQFEVIDVG